MWKQLTAWLFAFIVLESIVYFAVDDDIIEPVLEHPPPPGAAGLAFLYGGTIVTQHEPRMSHASLIVDEPMLRIRDLRLPIQDHDALLADRKVGVGRCFVYVFCATVSQ